MEQQEKVTQERVNKVEEFVNDVTDFVKKKSQKLVNIAKFNYVALTFSGIVFPFFILFMGAVAYYYKKKAISQKEEKYLIDNFQWQERTVYGAILFLIWILLLSFTIVGSFMVGAIGYIWYFYRLIKGWRALVSKKELYKTKFKKQEHENFGF
ncbi:hypothetical protein [Thermodesulfovibrio sp. TK110]